MFYERDIQKLVISYVKSIGYGNYCFHIPNHTLRGGGLKLAKMGQKSGIPDLFLAFPRPPRHFGLFLELKKPGGRLQVTQRKTLEILAGVGYCAEWTDSFEGAVIIINNYLGISMT